MAFLKLLSLCAFMFASSLAVGLLPLFVSLSARRVRYMTTVGVGLLVGVAFIVIIPEGVHTYYAPDGSSSSSSSGHSHAHSHDADVATPLLHTLSAAYNESAGQLAPIALPQPVAHDSVESLGSSKRLLSLHTEQTEQSEQSEHTERTEHTEQALPSATGVAHEVSALSSPCLPPHRDSGRVGMALVFGFVLMLLVDRSSGGMDGHSHGGGGGGGGGGSGLQRGHKPSASQGGGGGVSSGSKAEGGSHETDGTAGLPALLLTSPTLSSASLHPAAAASIAPSTKLAATASGVTSKSDYNNTAHSHSALSSTSTASTLGAAPATTPATVASASASSASASSSSSSLSSSSLQSSTSSSLSASSSAVSAPPAPLPSAALLGILTHSAIDGVALGAISVSDNASLELVVFLAIVLHKGPAAFGLASFLLHQGRSKAETRWHLVTFSLAAPLTSVATYLVFLQRELVSGGGGGSGGVSSEWLGLCLLFSAGTFLFTIAAHILPEVHKEGELVEWRYVACLILGILLPLALSGGHHHH